MHLVGSGNIVEQVIAPVNPVINLHDAGFNRLQNLADMVMLSAMLVHVHGQKLQRRIAGALSHSVEGAVHKHIALRLRFDHLDAVGIAHLKIVVGMVANANVRLQVCVQNFKNMIQIALMQQAIGIHHGHSIRMQIIHESNQFQQITVGIGGNGNRLNKHFISQILDLMAKFNGLVHNVLLKNHPDSIQIALFAGLQMLNGAGTIVDHSHNHCLLAIQLAENFPDSGRVRHDAAIDVKFTAIIQKAYFDNIHTGTDNPFKYVYQGIVSKFPVVDIPAIAQGAIQELYILHIICPFSHQALKAQNLFSTKFSGMVITRLIQGASHSDTPSTLTSSTSVVLPTIKPPP